MTENERMTVATRLYVRLRHFSGRTTDAMWMIENPAYAQEILRLSRASPDAELKRLADRFEWLMFGGKPVAHNGAAGHATPEPALNGHAPGGDGRYTGSLR